jgi:hypothetical protein
MLVAKQCAATFFCKFARNTPIYSGIFQSCYVLTNTKQLPIGQWLNTSGVHLVN